jgi:hypothetical protein
MAPASVIPAQAGIQNPERIEGPLDARLRGHDVNEAELDRPGQAHIPA